MSLQRMYSIYVRLYNNNTLSNRFADEPHITLRINLPGLASLGQTEQQYVINKQRNNQSSRAQPDSSKPRQAQSNLPKLDGAGHEDNACQHVNNAPLLHAVQPDNDNGQRHERDKRTQHGQQRLRLISKASIKPMTATVPPNISTPSYHRRGIPRSHLYASMPPKTAIIMPYCITTGTSKASHAA